MDIHAMVVDDSKIMRKMVMRSLQDADLATFTFCEAEDGADALKQFEVNEAQIQMMFVDWNMPNMNGIDFIREVRARQKKHIPVVMITTESSIGKMDEAMNGVKVDKYIAKPFTVEGLQKRLAPLFNEIAESQKKASKGGFFSKLASKVS